MNTLNEKIKQELSGNSCAFWIFTLMGYMFLILVVFIFAISVAGEPISDWMEQNIFFIFNILYITGIITNLIIFKILAPIFHSYDEVKEASNSFIVVTLVGYFGLNLAPLVALISSCFIHLCEATVHYMKGKDNMLTNIGTLLFKFLK